MKSIHMKSLFAEDPNRAQKFHLKWNDFLVDYSKNIITQETMDLLCELAKQTHLKYAIQKYFEGDTINKTEDRAVLHTALRAPESADIRVDGSNVMPEIYEVKNKIKTFTAEVIDGQRKGFTGKAFTDVVNIGIGGSDLGPRLVADALAFIQSGGIKK